MLAATPWKSAVTGGVGIVAGAVLVSVDWTLAPLAAFVGLALVARSALHLVTAASFVDFAGAFAVLEVAGDAGVGITALVWPGPTRMTLALLVGSWALVRAAVGATIEVTTRANHPWWLLSAGFATITGVLGVILIARSSGSTGATAVTIGVWAIVEGTREVLDAVLRDRSERRRRRVIHPQPSVAAS
jgi:uncharacterized membrane protein HdeD (DUF308 family)